MDDRTADRATGCGQVAAIALMVSWLGLVPVGVVFLLNALPGDAATSSVAGAAAILVTAAALLVSFAAVTLLTRSRAAWKETTAVATCGATIAGFLLIDAAVRVAFPESAGPSLHGEGARAAALRLGTLIPYTFLAAWLAPRLAGAPARSLWAWLGLDNCRLSTLLLALAVAALIAIPWPLTGALGDSLTSLSLAFQTLARLVPQALLFWGVSFCLLTSIFDRPWTAALTTILLYAAFTSGGVLPTGDWGALGNVVLLLPLAFLLTELRVRGGSVYPLLPVALGYHAVPLLFVDPRDVIAQGIPEPSHILSHIVALVIAILAGLVLWGSRWLISVLQARAQDHAQARAWIPGWVGLASAALAALIACSVWGGLYVFAGKPGFYDDGFLIILEEQADLGAAYTISDRETRIQYVYDTLVETAERTQAPLRAELDALGVPYRPYYIINMIHVDGHRWLMVHFERQPGVARVILNPNVREYPGRAPIPYGEDTLPIGKVQANLDAIHADRAWALGVTGEGIVVAGQDTGYDWTHPALKPRYRGWDGQSADHDYNWHDAWDDASVPFDDDSHGTHTIGIAVGDDGGGNRTGVAPGARWIGCRNMRRGFGNPGAYAECMEFFLAPYPHGGDPFSDGDVSQAPHVINNSWGCPDFEGCFFDTLEPAVEALRAAGIMMVVSAGNEGPACGTAVTPPANYDAAFSVGATRNSGNIVGFSNRGPVDGLIKPDITAPGEYVRSSVPGGGYAYAGGTSMAGPHVAGTVALLWSANPALIGDIDATEALICRTAVPRPVENVCTAEDEVPEGLLTAAFYNPVCACGGVTGVPNNVYGCGFTDAGAAVQAALER